ncbi:unnamed protein product [marine sediment metagenome]|uniref:Uncharacterized protein n=1 Tax=marine sediment metagenome TaxID=412755 RepID=X1G223_9ZZZZ
MSYSATWSNSNGQGRLVAGEHRIELSDAEELVAAVNRRHLLTYQSEQDFSSHVESGAYLRQPTVAGASAPPFDNFRESLIEGILSAPTGGMGGAPPTPGAMKWLWPEQDEDENKTIVSGASGVGEDEVGLFQKLNGTSAWTDDPLIAGDSPVRAMHFNELRQVIEWLRRGRWELPIYFVAGLFSPLPETPWIGDTIANNGTDELRSTGYAVIRDDQSPPLGLTNLTIRSSGYLELTADANCTVEVYHCLRHLEFADDPPTWNEYDPSASAAWSTPGGTGNGDATLIGSINLTANVPGSLSGADLTGVLQSMIDGGEQNFLVRRSDTGAATITLSGKLVVDFDLNSPPN